MTVKNLRLQKMLVTRAVITI